MTTLRLAAATSTAADENFYETAGTCGAVGHWCRWNELDDPLSSFVPETLSPAPGGVFLSGGGPSIGCGTAACCQASPSLIRIPGRALVRIKPCGRDRGRMEFSIFPLPSSSLRPAGPFDRASRDAPSRRRPRSAGRLRGLDV